MNIDNNGLEIDSLNNTLERYEEALKPKFGKDFFIYPEGIIDNIAASCSIMNMMLQEEIAKLAKEFDPETASGEYQDALYERIGLYRLEGKKTTFSCKIHGVPNQEYSARTITIRSLSDKNEFTNQSDFTTDSDGTALVRFQCVVEGAITVKNTDKFNIIAAPNGIISMSLPEDIQLNTGREEESDIEFRERFKNAKTTNAKSTRNAVFENLSKYVDHRSYLKLHASNSDANLLAGQIKIIAHPNTTDNIFAHAIFDTIVDGLETLGNTSVTVYDSEGIPVEIKFQKATEIAIDIAAEIKIKSGYYSNTVANRAKENILEYLKEHVFGLGSTIYATEFIIPILETDGIEAVQNIKVRRNNIASEFLDNISLEEDEIPAFSTEKICLTMKNRSS